MATPDLATHTPPEDAPSGVAELELRRLRKRYGPVTAVDGASLTVRAGRMCGFVGSNGAGKTTTMRMIMGVAAPDEGEVRWAGRPVDAAARLRFGYMPEERGLYPKMRVGEQLSYFAELHGFSRSVAHGAAGSWADRLGIGEHIDDRVETLSLGNQQRVQLAVALVHEPAVLILDEPFSGLDPMGVDALSAVLTERAADGVAVLFSSHQLELVERLCEDVVIISDGRLVVSGPVARLREGERRLLRVRVAGGDDARWTDGLRGVDFVRRDEAGTLLALAPDTDHETVLEAARSVGRVDHFGFERRSLADIFREVVER